MLDNSIHRNKQHTYTKDSEQTIAIGFIITNICTNGDSEKQPFFTADRCGDERSRSNQPGEIEPDNIPGNKQVKPFWNGYQRIVLSYNGNNNLTGINTPVNSTSFDYYANGNLMEITDPRGFVTSFTYDDNAFTFTISGLANSTSYDIYLYGAYDSRTSIVNFATDFTIGGVTKTAQALTSEPTTLDGTGWIENDHYVKFSVTSSSSGVITGTVSNHDDNDPNTTGDYGILSGMQIVPEPATMSLLGIGGLLALVRRRRK